MGSAVAQEIKWLRAVARQIDENIVGRASCLWIDNAGAAELASNATIKPRFKHINMRYHHLCQCVAEGAIKIERVISAKNPADIFTKPLDKVKFVKFRGIVGVGPVKTMGEQSQS